MLLHWLNKTIVVSRLVTISGDKLTFSTVTGAKAQIQPLDLEKTQIVGGVFGKTFRIWVDTALDIQEGDRLRDEDGNFYKVKKGGVTSRAFGSLDFKEVTIEKTT